MILFWNVTISPYNFLSILNFNIITFYKELSIFDYLYF